MMSTIHLCLDARMQRCAVETCRPRHRGRTASTGRSAILDQILPPGAGGMALPDRPTAGLVSAEIGGKGLLVTFLCGISHGQGRVDLWPAGPKSQRRPVDARSAGSHYTQYSPKSGAAVVDPGPRMTAGPKKRGPAAPEARLLS
jgi:hypothetical protein